jgi:hypothetical protein
MRRLLAPAVLAALLLTPVANAASLNKCIGARGEVTYSNMPCRDAQQVEALAIDPAPAAPPAAAFPPASGNTRPAPTGAPALRLETRRTSGAGVTEGTAAGTKRRCDAIADKLGRVLDTMDQARRKGYTQDQADAWNREIKDLERKKQQAGCF